jgi:hypothetical protein
MGLFLWPVGCASDLHWNRYPGFWGPACCLCGCLWRALPTFTFTTSLLLLIYPFHCENLRPSIPRFINLHPAAQIQSDGCAFHILSSTLPPCLCTPSALGWGSLICSKSPVPVTKTCNCCAATSHPQRVKGPHVAAVARQRPCHACCADVGEAYRPRLGFACGCSGQCRCRMNAAIWGCNKES